MAGANGLMNTRHFEQLDSYLKLETCTYIRRALINKTQKQKYLFNVFLINAIVYLKKRIIREICISYNLCLLVAYCFDLLTSWMETTKVKDRQRGENLILHLHFRDGPLIRGLW